MKPNRTDTDVTGRDEAATAFRLQIGVKLGQMVQGMLISM
jgi:hypothetical protein